MRFQPTIILVRTMYVRPRTSPGWCISQCIEIKILNYRFRWLITLLCIITLSIITGQAIPRWYINQAKLGTKRIAIDFIITPLWILRYKFTDGSNTTIILITNSRHQNLIKSYIWICIGKAYRMEKGDDYF